MQEREYPNKALEAKGVPAANEAAAAEPASFAENKPYECRVRPVQLGFFLSRSSAIAIPAIDWILILILICFIYIFNGILDSSRCKFELIGLAR